MNKKSLLIILLFGFVNFFYRVDAATTCVKNQDSEKAANFLAVQKSFLDRISPQDCKNLLQVLRCHELVLEYFFAARLTRKSDQFMDSRDFDANQAAFLKQEKKTFDLLSSEAKAFLDLMQDFIRDEGVGFDFRTIPLLFEMRAQYLCKIQEFIKQVIVCAKWFSGSLGNEEIFKTNKILKRFKSLFIKNVSARGTTFTLDQIFKIILADLSRDISFFDYTSVKGEFGVRLFNIAEYCKAPEEFLKQFENPDATGRIKVVLGVLKQVLTPLLDAGHNFFELDRLFRNNYSEIQDYITTFYNNIGLFKYVYGMVYNEIYQKLSDSEKFFNAADPQFSNVTLPKAIFIFNQKQDDLDFCKKALTIFKKMNEFREKHFVLKQVDDGFFYEVVEDERFFRDVATYKRECAEIFKQDDLLKSIFTLDWLKPSTLVDRYKNGDFDILTVSLTFLFNNYTRWFEKRIAMLEFRQRPSAEASSSYVLDQIVLQKQKEKSSSAKAKAKKVKPKKVKIEESPGAACSSDAVPSVPLHSEVKKQEPECVTSRELDQPGHSSLVVKSATKRNRFTDITKEIWTFRDDHCPSAEVPGVFTTWVLSWDLFNYEGMTLVLYPEHSNSINFEEFSFDACREHNFAKFERGDKFHNIPDKINKCLKNGYYIDFDDPKALDIFKQTFPGLHQSLRPAINCFAIVIEAKITSKHYFRSYLNEADVRSTRRLQRSHFDHNGLIVWIFDKKRKTCFHKFFHEFEESYRRTHTQ